MTDVIDAESVELAVREPALGIVPTVQAGDLVQRLAVIRDAMRDAMERDIDYGVVPGTDKPTLFKPGAEKLSVLFQLNVQLENTKTWGPGDHLTVESKATVYHAPTGTQVGFGEGVCSTREKKYAYRNAERVCPQCGKANLRHSKDKPEWYCWRKTDGCGAVFPESDERIKSQTAGRVENPDLPDLWNVVVKMAEKRARVDAVLAVTGASALFTQDVEADEPQTSAQPAGPSVVDRLDDETIAVARKKAAIERLDGLNDPLAFLTGLGVSAKTGDWSVEDVETIHRMLDGLGKSDIPNGLDPA